MTEKERINTPSSLPNLTEEAHLQLCFPIVELLIAHRTRRRFSGLRQQTSQCAHTHVFGTFRKQVASPTRSAQWHVAAWIAAARITGAILIIEGLSRTYNRGIGTESQSTHVRTLEKNRPVAHVETAEFSNQELVVFASLCNLDFLIG